MDTLYSLLSQLVKDSYSGHILITQKLNPDSFTDPMHKDLYLGFVNKVPTKYFNWYIYTVGYSLANRCICVDITEDRYNVI